MTTPAALGSGEPAPCSFGWRRRIVDGRLRYGHGGETNGADAQVACFPDAELAVAGIANFNFRGPAPGEPACFELVPERRPALLADAGRDGPG